MRYLSRLATVMSYKATLAKSEADGNESTTVTRRIILDIFWTRFDFREQNLIRFEAFPICYYIKYYTSYYLHLLRMNDHKLA